MDEELTALAAAGAAALVAAMATDLWQGTRDATLGLFRRASRRQRATVEAQLDNNAALVRQSGAPDEVRRALLGYWSAELDSLVRRDPESRARLARLAGQAPTAPAGDEPAASPRGGGLRQRNTAARGGTVFAVQGGDQPVYGWGGPGDGERRGERRGPGARDAE